jgi:hypothetical protein
MGDYYAYRASNSAETPKLDYENRFKDLKRQESDKLYGLAPKKEVRSLSGP